MWMIRAINDEGLESVAYESEFGPDMWNYTLGFAIYPTFEKAQEVFEQLTKETITNYSDGSKSPYRPVHIAMRICNNKPTGSVKFQLCEIGLNPIVTKEMFWPPKPDSNKNWYLD